MAASTLVEQALASWREQQWDQAAASAEAAFAQSAPMALAHVLLASLLRSGHEARARTVLEMLRANVDDWTFALLQRTMGDISGEALFATAPRDADKLAEAWLIHGERLATEGKIELAAVALREAPSVSSRTPYLLIHRELPVPTDTERASTMAQLKQSMGSGQYPEGIAGAARLLELAEQSGEPAIPDRPLALGTLALALSRNGRISEAMRIAPAAVQVSEHLLGPLHRHTITAVQNFASILRESQRIGDAESMARLALSRAQARAERGLTDDLLPRAHDNLGSLLFARAQEPDVPDDASRQLLAESSEHMRVALRGWQALFGTGHPQYRRTAVGLASVLRKAGDEAGADAVLRAITTPPTSDATHDDPLVLSASANTAMRQGQWKTAEGFYRQAIDAARRGGTGRSTSTAATLANFALALHVSRNPEALRAIQEAAFVDDLLIGQIFSIASSSERSRLLNDVRVRDERMLFITSFWLSPAMQAALGQGTPEAIAMRKFTTTAIAACAQSVLQRKGLSVEALAMRWEAMLPGRYPDLADDIERLRQVELSLASYSTAGAGDTAGGTRAASIAALGQQARQLEASIVSRVPEMDISRRVSGVSAFEVSARLPAGAVLLEYVRYVPWDDADGTRYACVVLPAGRSEDVELVDLGLADAIDADVAAFRAHMIAGDPRGRVRDSRVRAVPDLEASRDAGVRLRTRLIDTTLAKHSHASHIIVAPDGDLCWLPFGALPAGDDRFLQDGLGVSYIGSGRDVLSWGRMSHRTPGAPIVAAAPDFGSGAPGGGLWDDLPGTLIEGRRVAAILGVAPFEGARVDRNLFLSCRGPRILHVATHGYYIPEKTAPAAGSALFSPEALANPMLRSGLALAGANEPDDAPGLLSAAEVTSMDLRGTELVVMSACETGIGEVERGEGVSGLRRAFSIAGARRLVVSLWSVPDEPTAALMEAFHGYLNDGHGASDALRQAQLKVRQVYPEPVNWAAFILQGEIGAFQRHTMESEQGSGSADAEPGEDVASQRTHMLAILEQAADALRTGRAEEGATLARTVAEALQDTSAATLRAIRANALQLAAVGALNRNPAEARALALQGVEAMQGVFEERGDEQALILEAALLKVAASAERKSGSSAGAIDYQARAGVLLDRARFKEETPLVLAELASLSLNLGNALDELGQYRAAYGQYTRSMELWSTLSAQSYPLAEAYGAKARLFRASVQRSLGDTLIALAEARAGAAVLLGHNAETGPPDLAGVMTWATKEFGSELLT